MKQIKKVAIALFCVFLLLFCACNRYSGREDGTPPPAPVTFETDLIVVLNEIRLMAHFQQRSPGFGLLTVTAPENLQGLEMRFEGTECQISYRGLNFGADVSKLPESAFGNALIQILAARLSEAEVTRTYREGKWRFEGNSAAGGFLLVQDAETGDYEYISIPSIDLTIQFVNFQRNTAV